jgi:succinoglycan biosynthesis transport protein ExoP
VYAKSQRPVYEAVGRIKLVSPFERTLFRQERGVAFVDIDRYLNAQADMIKSPEVLARAAQLMNNKVRPGQIRQSVNAQSSTTILEVSVRGRSEDPAQAAEMVNAVTAAYEDVAEARVNAEVKKAVTELRKLESDLRERLEELPEDDDDPRVRSERDNLSDELASLQTKAGQIRADAAIYGAGVERIDQAFPSEAPVSESPRRTAVIFALLGFIVALVGAFWRSERVQVIDSSGDAAGAVDTPLLGVLPKHASDTALAAAPVVTAPESPAAREHQFIASNVTLLASESGARVLLVTSPEASEAKAVTALNVALSAAQDQRAVILVDIDDTGAMTRLLDADGSPGVSDFLARGPGDDLVLPGDLAAIEQFPPVFAYAKWHRAGRGPHADPADSIAGFRFVPAGTAKVYGRSTAASPHLAKLLAQLQQEADVIVLNGPSLLESPGGIKLAAIVDGVVLVVRRGTRVAELRKALVLLSTAKAPVLGHVFDQSRRPRRWLRRSERPGPARRRHFGS